MIKLPLRISPQVRYRPAEIIDAEGHVVDLEVVVGLVGALTIVLNAAKMHKKHKPEPLMLEDTILHHAADLVGEICETTIGYS